MKREKAVAGYTLLELITVIVLLGILSVAAVSRFNLSPFETAGFEQELRSAIRFAQKFAIVSGCEVQVSVIDATDSYSIDLRSDVNANGCLGATNPAFTLPLNNPAGGTFGGNAPAGVDLGPDLSFIYDRQGQPTAGVNITVDTLTIVVEPVTGYVY